MTQTDRLNLFKRAVNDHGQAAVARKIDYSPSAVNQILKGSYKGSLDAFLQRVAEVFGKDTTQCPVLGEIALSRCAMERKKPFSPSSPIRAKLWIACKDCERKNI